MKLLIDADFIVYKACAAAETEIDWGNDTILVTSSFNDAYSATALHGCRMTVGTGGDFNVYAPDKGSSPGDIKFFTDEAERIAILAAGGMTFNGDTAAANALDDYEEGTFSPVPRGSTGTAGSHAHNMGGVYTKIGRMCTVTVYGVMTNKGDWTGDAEVHGLPFTIGGNAPSISGASNGAIGLYPATEVDAVWRTAALPTDVAVIKFKKGSRMDYMEAYSDWDTGYYLTVTASYWVA